MAVPLPPLDLSSFASSSSSGYQAPIQFGDYTASPIIGSANEPLSGGSVGQGLPLWVWPLVLIGAYLMVKKKGAK